MHPATARAVPDQDASVLCGGNVLVVDDFLSSPTAELVWQHVCRSPLRGMHHDAFERVQRLYDGECLIGPNVTFTRGAAGTNPDREAASRPSSSEPTTNGLQALFEALLASVPVDRFLSDRTPWRTVKMRPYVYPVSTGLGWHTDRHKTAAFIYYAHPEWRSHWGGELMVASGMPAARDPSAPGFRDFYQDFDDGRLEGKEVGTYLLPVPNRMVVIAGGVPHCIKRVEPAAGDAFRASIAGFYLGD